MASRNILIFTAKAHEELDDILFYIEHELCNPKASKDLLIEFINKTDFIKVFPESHPIVENDFYNYKDIRKVNIGNYSMFYRYDSDAKEIIILTIIYTKRNIDNLIQLLQ